MTVQKEPSRSWSKICTEKAFAEDADRPRRLMQLFQISTYHTTKVLIMRGNGSQHEQGIMHLFWCALYVGTNHETEVPTSVAVEQDKNKD